MVELLVAVGANGIGLMVTLVVPIGPGQPQQLQIQSTYRLLMWLLLQYLDL